LPIVDLRLPIEIGVTNIVNRQLAIGNVCWSKSEMHSNIKLLFQIGERSPSRNSTGRSLEIAALQLAIVNRQSQIVDVSC
jgi:hypothetical protein